VIRAKSASRSTILVSAAICTVLLLVAACGDGGHGRPASPGRQTVRVALDWIPNTVHTGLYVAQQEGWFAAAGVDVQFLPHSTTAPETLVDSGAADIGFSYPDSFTYAKAAGSKITSVLAFCQHWTSELAVKADRDDIASPKDLDGKTFGAFGGPGELAKIKAVIKGAGGRGDFKTVMIGGSAEEALNANRVDFYEMFPAWEGIKAQMHGPRLKTFAFTDYGFPDSYGGVLIANSPWLADNPDLARAFVQAAQRGYQLSADDPAKAAKDLMAANPGSFSDPELVYRSQEMIAERYLKDANGRVGTQQLDQWAGYVRWVFDSRPVPGPEGDPLKAPPDVATWFTNDYLAK
jgi:ABC-type nitrate/sulfonate/bicarbonate transport system substrate-binding protein